VPSRDLGEDPSGPAVRKPPGLPWVVAPLVISGKLFGYIAADKRVTRADISAADLEYVSLFGVLAAQAIANEQIRRPRFEVWGTLFEKAADKIRLLYESPTGVPPEENGPGRMHVVQGLLINGDTGTPVFVVVELTVSIVAVSGGVLVFRFGFRNRELDEALNVIEVALVHPEMAPHCAVAENRGMHEFEVLTELPEDLENAWAELGRVADLPFRLMLRGTNRR
jgi:hypothetical protein